MSCMAEGNLANALWQVLSPARESNLLRLLACVPVPGARLKACEASCQRLLFNQYADLKRLTS